MKKGFIFKSSSRGFLSGISALFTKQRDPRLQTSGMVSGFTLIELLVVVLIIGILSAIALPQYQKAVEKSKAAKMLALVRPLAQAAELYYINNGTAPTNIDTLDVNLSEEQKQKIYCATSVNCQKEDFAVYLYDNVLFSKAVLVMNTAGKYTGGGFIIFYDKGNTTKDYVPGKLYCYERTVGTNKFNLSRGDYCKKIFGATFFDGVMNADIFSMP